MLRFEDSDPLAYPGDTALAVFWPKPPHFWPAKYENGQHFAGDMARTRQWAFLAETTRWSGYLLPDGRIGNTRRSARFEGDTESAYAEAKRRCAACTKLTRKRPHTVYTLAVS